MTNYNVLYQLSGLAFCLMLASFLIVLAFLLVRGLFRLWRGSSQLPVPSSLTRSIEQSTDLYPAVVPHSVESQSVSSPPESPVMDEPASTARLVIRPGLSLAERRFLEFLNKTTGEQYLIQTKIPLRDIIGRYGWLEKNLHTMHKHGHIDFLLCDPRSMHPLLAIELDDKTHNRPDRQDADHRKQELLDRAGLQLIRIRVGDLWGNRERDLIQSALERTRTGLG